MSSSPLRHVAKTASEGISPVATGSSTSSSISSVRALCLPFALAESSFCARVRDAAVCLVGEFEGLDVVDEEGMSIISTSESGSAWDVGVTLTGVL